MGKLRSRRDDDDLLAHRGAGRAGQVKVLELHVENDHRAAPLQEIGHEKAATLAGPRRAVDENVAIAAVADLFAFEASEQDRGSGDAVEKARLAQT